MEGFILNSKLVKILSR